ncbi:MAG: hypothetical protein OEV42_15940 [Deltaproteobacteria bacterium]|nr:hypothetical protein [Deltaproteobacteria bacterium]
MALQKLEILENSLARFRSTFDSVRAERDALEKEVEALKAINQKLIKEKDSVKTKIDILISRIDELGL